MFGDYQDLGLQAKTGRFRVAVLIFTGELCPITPEILVLAGTAGASRMAPPASSRISARLKRVQEHSSRVHIGVANAQRLHQAREFLKPECAELGDSAVRALFGLLRDAALSKYVTCYVTCMTSCACITHLVNILLLSC